MPAVLGSRLRHANNLNSICVWLFAFVISICIVVNWSLTKTRKGAGSWKLPRSCFLYIAWWEIQIMRCFTLLGFKFPDCVWTLNKENNLDLSHIIMLISKVRMYFSFPIQLFKKVVASKQIFTCIWTIVVYIGRRTWQNSSLNTFFAHIPNLNKKCIQQI